MPEENQVIPLALTQIHHRSDEAFSSTKHKNLHQKRSSKIFFYILTAIVLQSVGLLIFALIALRFESPQVKITSVSTKNLRYSTSPWPSLNMTLIAQITVDNKNFGRFKLKKNSSKASVLYGNITIGDTLINGWSVRARKRESVKITVQVRANGGLSENMNISSEVKSGLVKMIRSYAELRGEVHAFKIIKKHKTAIMNCTMSLNLTSQAIHNLLCK
ncbi:unnamed protein product [Ilex paraguariensis]|uniref:Late embryogenesis abundant protein LEA-2 subgroup domain-containing protein n=1 Tax=Ilex paraguariensis TaxID=185542 RepID=A0ABC8U0X3_9AQUA